MGSFLKCIDLGRHCIYDQFIEFEAQLYFSYTPKGYIHVNCTEYRMKNRNNSRKNTNKYNFPNFLLKEKKSRSRLFDHIIGNLPACFQIYGLFIRNQTAFFRNSGFYFAGSYCSEQTC